MTSLFPLPEPEVPPLIAARRRLEQAQAAYDKLPSDCSVWDAQQARVPIDAAEIELARLEQAEIERMKR